MQKHRQLLFARLFAPKNWHIETKTKSSAPRRAFFVVKRKPPLDAVVPQRFTYARLLILFGGALRQPQQIKHPKEEVSIAKPELQNVGKKQGLRSCRRRKRIFAVLLQDEQSGVYSWRSGMQSAQGCFQRKTKRLWQLFFEKAQVSTKYDEKITAIWGKIVVTQSKT